MSIRPIRIVESKQNPRVKELRATLQRPGRGEAELVALEGIHLVAEAVRSGLQLQTVFVAQGHEHLLAEVGIDPTNEVEGAPEILAVPFEILASAVSTESPQPIAALAHPKHWPWAELLGNGSELLGSGSTALIVVLSGIQDPGNLGTILRSAEAFGATGVICLTGTVSRWNAKAMRASAGSVFRLPVIATSESKCFQHLREAGVPILATMAHEAKPLGETDLAGPVALVIGSEGGGISAETAAQCDARITIPCPGPVESLNAAVAASVLLYEASRQRNPVVIRTKA
jgi:RNA methyltransferase, TrmH family